ncbi:Putative major facilitator superfamily, MFS transporter superfamily [Septoria linicola]|uniref:Major facilitator superfamily, MFS transporter superfamily n=1 Tax=Septoria linicola TaxID=215465 RepID=A0A9Q9AG55_9PEZI|nr:putative major facilitator superfamily, MFS transporter superfamily [Septoria linicola]USW48470.1 Putative major facilitator superfamily, MFS transporter superfamily [Septoria linicola]
MPSASDRRAQKPSLHHRTSSTIHYQTFPTAPPRDAGRPPKDMKSNGSTERTPPSRENSDDSAAHQQETPLPTGQLAILAVIALAEQTALNSISPYLPDMASSFPNVKEENIGMYVGLIASAFALAQFATNFLWGWLSDRIGRKPIVLTGTLFTAVCFIAFGFSRRLWHAILIQALMGVVNGNQGVISTCLGEITDRSNQSRAFTYLPVIYGLGGITGPLIGGLLVMREHPFKPGQPNPYPYLLPNLFSAGVLLIDFVLTAIFLKESLDTANELPPFKKRVGSLFAWIWQFTSSSKPTYLRRKKNSENHGYGTLRASDSTVEEEDDEDDNDEDEEANEEDESAALFHHNHEELGREDVFNRDTVLLLISYLIFQLSNVSFNSLYPIFSEGRPPTGRNLSPEEIGTSLAFAGLITILFQVGIFGKLREKMGNKATYRTGLAGFVLAFLLMPWVGYKDGKDGTHDPTKMGKIWLWAELGAVLLIKTVASVGGLTSALLLITNSAPSHAVLGTLNGLAQTLSAGGRALGPFISGSLFTAATRVQPKGEAMAFGVFGGISFIGFLMSWGIRSAQLEAEGDESTSEDEEEAESDGETSPERRR